MMNQAEKDHEYRAIIDVHFSLIEDAVKLARTNMSDKAGSYPELVDHAFQIIHKLAENAQRFKWPDPAKLAQAASQDAALQKLIKRVSQRTPIRAKGGKA